MADTENSGGVGQLEAGQDQGHGEGQGQDQGQEQGQANPARPQVVDINLADSGALQTELKNALKLSDEVMERTKNVLAGLSKSFETRDARGLQGVIDQFTTFLNREVTAAAARMASLNTAHNRGINTVLQTKDGRITVNVGRGLNALLPDPTRQGIRQAIKKNAFIQ